MIEVELGTNWLGYPEATYELGLEGPRTVITVEGYEDDTYESAARSLCRALALLGFRGEVGLYYDGLGDEEEKQEILASVEALRGKLHITNEDAERAAEKELQAAGNLQAGYKRLSSAIKEESLRRGLTKEEREKLTVEEALRDEDEQ